MERIICCVLIGFGTINCGLIPHDSAVQHHEHATSYQNVHIEHFHSVPTFIKHEYKELLEHPIPSGTTSSKLEVHHGHNKYDPGYAIVDSHNHHQQNYEFNGHFDGHNADQLETVTDDTVASLGNYQAEEQDNSHLAPNYGSEAVEDSEGSQHYYAGDEQLPETYNYH